MLSIFGSMAILKGSLIYSNRKYKYKVEVCDVGESIPIRFTVRITNPAGATRDTYWDFRTESIEQAVIKYILSQKRIIEVRIDDNDRYTRRFSKKN